VEHCEGISRDSATHTCCDGPQPCTQLETAVQVTVFVGFLYLGVGLLRLGFLANFLSHSVISGFTTGAAMIIGLSQLKYMLGVRIPNSHTALKTFIELCKAVGDAQWREVVMCLAWLAILLALKKVAKRYPKLSWMRPLGPISVCAIAILTVVVERLDKQDAPLIRTVRHVPQGVQVSPVRRMPGSHSSLLCHSAQISSLPTDGHLQLLAISRCVRLQACRSSQSSTGSQ
jgi:MFS superfamily sulfate permease-like transporter